MAATRGEDNKSHTTPALPGPVGARPPAPAADQAPATKRSRPVVTSGKWRCPRRCAGRRSSCRCSVRPRRP
ncbi:hypothetical protein G6F35_017961 [Rhizopus arrhizus]|nr:hypothetical protein G6F35_017961 [Rhizopus arrhizus]